MGRATLAGEVEGMRVNPQGKQPSFRLQRGTLASIPYSLFQRRN